jgi:hypothetical protein
VGQPDEVVAKPLVSGNRHAPSVANRRGPPGSPQDSGIAEIRLGPYHVRGRKHPDERSES